MRSTKKWEVRRVRKPRVPFRSWTAVALVLGVLVASSALTQQSVAQSVVTIMTAKLMEPNQKTPEVSTDELFKILADRSATVFDARPRLEYAVSHIPGALNVAPKPGVPMSLYVSDVNEIGRILGGNKETPIVLYCNGPFCGKSKRLGDELVAAGYTNVRRYQLGIPTWRALVGLTAIELEGALYVFRGDKTAVFIDARDPEEFKAGTIPGARNLPDRLVLPGKDVGEVAKAKDDGRLPMEDHNTRIVVIGKDSAQARHVAEAIAREAFHNVAYFVGTFDTLKSVIR
ncbi:MAG: sulfur transferase [Bacillati bacterium ANGP1]|uniref:Sulfur transferase n=1 Tax=Candidatus Segetimicrobium genomatis TaxID=2569760 RepID=A0A537JKJ5_9BACT|nr:MAG: sulfur transferase [Terrabacteria group bacterium ANGP1]